MCGGFPKVIKGANHTVANGLGVLTWESRPKSSPAFLDTLEYLATLNFSCYGLGDEGATKLSKSCRSEATTTTNRQMNILCASSKYAPSVVTAMDALSHNFKH